MARRLRNRQKHYYYRTVRQGTNVLRTYVGPRNDPITQLLFRKKRLHHASQQARREQYLDEVENYDGIEHRIRQYFDQCRLLFKSWLSDRGYRLEPYDKVRVLKRRNKPIMRFDELNVLIRRAEAGEAESLQDLRMLINSEWANWQPFGDLSTHVKRHFIELLAGTTVVDRETLAQNLVQMATNLGQGSRSPIRNLAIDQVLIAWLDVNYQQLQTAVPRPSTSEAELLERRVQRAQRRYAFALESLARIDQIEQGKVADV